MIIDDVLSNLSSEVFSGIDDDHHRILKIISKNDILNLEEIGEQTSAKHYAGSFDRWGVKIRLNGSTRTFGLIPNDYVYRFSVNKKESKYGLTLKGLLASLYSVSFEKNYLVNKYKDKLLKVLDEKIVDWLIQLIKYEIVIILFYAKIQGLDWTRFKQTRLYIHDIKQHSKQILIPFYLNKKRLNYQQKQEYESIKTKYLELVMIIKLIRSIYEERVRNFSTLEVFKKQAKKRKIDETIQNSFYNWYMEIDGENKKIIGKSYDELFIDRDPYYSRKRWIRKKGKMFGEISKMLENNDYKSEYSTSMPT